MNNFLGLQLFISNHFSSAISTQLTTYESEMLRLIGLSVKIRELLASCIYLNYSEEYWPGENKMKIKGSIRVVGFFFFLIINSSPKEI